MKNRDGISLITLIISCTIMGILALTIIIAISSNHISYLDNDIEDECADSQGNILTVKNGDNEIEIGSTINYMPDGVGPTNYKEGWKLLGEDENGNLLILSNKSIIGSYITLRRT